jgi:NCS1 family nucleobase:cation symporter-1
MVSIPGWVYSDALARQQTGTEAMLQNADLKVVEPARRLWSKRNFVAFWLADSINLNTWMIIGSSVTAGLSWWEAWIATWIGYSIVAIFICISGRIGATYHISFPVASRASWGIWFSLWPIFNRGAMACVWYGVQAWLGGQCFVLMIRAMKPSFNDIGTRNLDGGQLGTRDFVGFVLFWTVSLIFIYPPVHKIRHLFTVKAIVVPIAGVLFMVWAIVKAGGIGPVVHQKGTLTGSARGWAWITSIMACVSNFATLIVNNPDFTRFAKTPSSAFLPQLFTIPMGFALTCFVGVIVGSASETIYGEKLWNPLDLMSRMLDSNPSSATRAGVWFIALSFALAQLGVNIAANSVSAGSDLTA